LKPVEPLVASAWFLLSKPTCEELVSSFAFNFNWRRYMMAKDTAGMLKVATDGIAMSIANLRQTSGRD
jgi:hypothetical protein